MGSTRIAGLRNVGPNNETAESKSSQEKEIMFSKTYHLRYINHCRHSLSLYVQAVGFLHHHGRVRSHANGRSKIIMVDFAGMSHSGNSKGILISNGPHGNERLRFLEEHGLVWWTKNIFDFCLLLALPNLEL